jgi:hypothetical protein
MKTMKQNSVAVLRRPEARDSGWDRRVTRRRLAVVCLAIYAVLPRCLAPARAADVPPVGGPNNPSARAQQPGNRVQGREMQRYKAFVRQADLPFMRVTNDVLIEVGGAVRLDATRLTQLSARDKEALAKLFSVPAGVVERVVQRAATNSLPSADHLVTELRTAVVDYRFLEGEWERFHPPAEGQQIRSNALSALQNGDIAKAWELYDGLSRPEPPVVAKPAPPTNLRAIVGP